jgi:hypothetical protein
MSDEETLDQPELDSEETTQPPHNPFLVITAVVLMIILIALILFQTLEGKQVTAPAILMQTGWILQSYSANGTLVPAEPGVLVTARFNGTGVTGFSGCNQYFANIPAECNETVLFRSRYHAAGISIPLRYAKEYRILVQWNKP